MTTVSAAVKKPSSNGMLNARTRADKIFDAINLFLVGLVLLIVLYPLYLVLICSVSSPSEVLAGRVTLYPKGFTWTGYETLIQNTAIWRAYLNSIVYTFVGTALSIGVTMAAAYGLSRKFLFKKGVTLFFVFTMFFNGGLVPTFIQMRQVGLYNNPLILVLMGCLSVWNMMLARTYIRTALPDALFEAAMIDGATHFTCFFKIVLPLSGTIIGVLSVYYGIGRWNDYYTGMIYIVDQQWLPLQTVLKTILASLKVDMEMLAMFSDSLAGDAEAMQRVEVAKYCMIVVSTVPAIILYLFMQKFFVKGVMIGSMKG